MGFRNSQTVRERWHPKSFLEKITKHAHCFAIVSNRGLLNFDAKECEMLTDELLSEPFGVYQARSKDHLSSHQLADFRRCPALYYQKQRGLIPDEDRPAYELGRAAHTLIL